MLTAAVLALLLALLLLPVLAGCGSNVTPGNSLRRLSFTPASPDKQVLTKEGRSPQIIITNYNETATDALGRTLPTSDEVGLPKKGRYVGLFYSLWTSEISAPVDVSKVLAQNPDAPDYGPKWGFGFWSEPETGYHKADDVWQIKRDLNYFALAGVDFLYFDMTNGFMYENAMRVFLDTCVEMRAGGQMTPYVVPWCYGTDAKASHCDIGKFYEIFMTDEKYADLWFCWDGLPLALIKPTDDGTFPILDDAEFAEKLTFRKSWVGSGEQYWVDGGLFFGYSYGWYKDPTKAECIGIGTAGFANFGSGRSGVESNRYFLDKFLETDTMGEGITFEDTFRQVMENNPECEVLLITRWNEWIAQNFTQDKPKPTNTGYVDEFNAEFSRDIEPMKGGFTDNYFYQMCSIIRRFKGVLPPDDNTGARTVDVDGEFAQWQAIVPVFTDFQGDTGERHSTDTTGRIEYVNTTGRNDIVESRMTADRGSVYFYARTAAPLTPAQEGQHWMLLFIDADNNKTTGWEGYDYLVNYEVVNAAATTLCAYRDNVWQEIGLVRYRAEGNELMLAIPRSLLGLTGAQLTVEFHWLDNVDDVYSLEAWFTTGDSAPERRNNYTLTLKVPYKAAADQASALAAELAASVGDRKKLEYMPAAVLTPEAKQALTEGIGATVYELTPDYGKMPVFRLIDANERGSRIVAGIGPAVLDGFTANYAAEYNGYVKVDADGSYSFTLTCDDCARLYIDGRLLAECAYDAERPPENTVSASGSLRLAAGYHLIKVEYAEVREGGAALSLSIGGGSAKLYTASGKGSSRLTVDFRGVEGMNGNPTVLTNAIEIRSYNTVLRLGEFDLSQYSQATISYGSDGNAMLGDVGSFFALTNSRKYVNKSRRDNILGKEAVMENAEGRSWVADREVVIDLSEVTYSGPVFLAIYMGDFNGVTVYDIEFS